MNNSKKNNREETNNASSRVSISCDVGINGNHLKSVEKSTFIQRISLHF
jgi:hypothetical protein